MLATTELSSVVGPGLACGALALPLGVVLSAREGAGHGSAGETAPLSAPAQ